MEKHHRKHLFIFFITLLLVLSAGAAVLCAYMYVSGRVPAAANAAASDTDGKSVSAFWEKADIRDVPGWGASAESESENTADTEAADPETEDSQVIEDDDDSITFTFAGDILFDPSYAAGAAIAARGIENCFDDKALDIMKSADIFMLNNEFTYTTAAQPLPDKKYTFKADPSSADNLRKIGTDIVALANNHIFDYQEQGLLDTLDTLDGIGMTHVGAGRNLAEASKAAYYTCGDFTIAILNATQIEGYENPPTRGATDTLPGVFRCYDPTLLYQTVTEVSQKADFVIVYIHWGTESTTVLDANQTEHAKGLAAAGCDLVVGDHPHVLQGIQYVDGMPVIYSLGNYLFTSYDRDTGVLQAQFSPSEKKMTSLRFVPMLQSGTAVRTLSGTEKERVLQDMRKISTAAIDEDGYITEN